jgi:hypothetical protein
MQLKADEVTTEGLKDWKERSWGRASHCRFDGKIGRYCAHLASEGKDYYADGKSISAAYAAAFEALSPATSWEAYQHG